jgi:hypothetical protein
MYPQKLGILLFSITPRLDYSLKKPTSQAGWQLYLSKEQSALKADIKALSLMP